MASYLDITSKELFCHLAGAVQLPKPYIRYCSLILRSGNLGGIMAFGWNFLRDKNGSLAVVIECPLSLRRRTNHWGENPCAKTPLL